MFEDENGSVLSGMFEVFPEFLLLIDLKKIPAAALNRNQISPWDRTEF